VAVFEETAPSDGSRLLASLAAWAGYDSAAAVRTTVGVTEVRLPESRFHYLLRCDDPAGLFDRQALRERIDALVPPLPAVLASALLQGWPAPLRGLHRIELAPGRAWISIAIGLKPSIRRRLAGCAAAPVTAPMTALPT